jgi:hypothetical protein
MELIAPPHKETRQALPVFWKTSIWCWRPKKITAIWEYLLSGIRTSISISLMWLKITTHENFLQLSKWTGWIFKYRQLWLFVLLMDFHLLVMRHMNLWHASLSGIPSITILPVSMHRYKDLEKSLALTFFTYKNILYVTFCRQPLCMRSMNVINKQALRRQWFAGDRPGVLGGNEPRAAPYDN